MCSHCDVRLQVITTPCSCCSGSGAEESTQLSIKELQGFMMVKNFDFSIMVKREEGMWEICLFWFQFYHEIFQLDGMKIILQQVLPFTLATLGGTIQFRLLPMKQIWKSFSNEQLWNITNEKFKQGEFVGTSLAQNSQKLNREQSKILEDFLWRDGRSRSKGKKLKKIIDTWIRFLRDSNAFNFFASIGVCYHGSLWEYKTFDL